MIFKRMIFERMIFERMIFERMTFECIDAQRGGGGGWGMKQHSLRQILEKLVNKNVII